MKIPKNFVKNVPVVGQAYSVIETVKKVSKITDSVEALVQVTDNCVCF